MNLRQRLPALAWDRPVSILMVFIAAMVLGFIAYARLPVQLLPSGIEPGFLWVWVPYPNAAPVEVDDRIVRPIETQFGTVSGVKQMISRASSGSAQFALEFHSGADMDEAYNSVVDRLERAMPDLPDDVERYGVFRYNPNDDPIVLVGASFPPEIEDPYYVMTRVVQPALERVPGVAALDVWGVPQQGIWVEYDKDRVYSHGVNLGELQRRIQTDNFQMSSGKLVDRGRVLHARGLSPFSVEDLIRYPVANDVVLSDIADIGFRAAQSTTIARVNGQKASAVAIRKDSAANTIDVAQRIEGVFEELADDPRTGGAEFFVFFNQGDLIQDSLQTLVNAALFGGLFAIGILWMFLREWRMTLLIAASIPFSILITLGLLYFTGNSLNLLSMMGLMLAVGMVVDNAIVVVETIYRRRARGDAPRRAAVEGTGEVNLAIIVSTITTMIVFLPVILMSQDARVAFFLEAIGVPVIFALAASLVVALLFAPLATRYIGAAQVKPDPGWLQRLAQGYETLLRTSLRRRADGLMVMLAMIFLTGAVAIPGVQCNAESESNLNDFVVRYTVPEQADMAERDAIVAAMERTVEENAEAWGVRVFRTNLRSSATQGRLFVYLETDGNLDRETVMQLAQEAFPKDLPGVEVRVGWEGGFEQQAANQINLSVVGEDVGRLRDLGEEVARRVRSVPGVLGVELDVETDGSQEIQLVVDRTAANRYGVGATQIGSTVAYAMRGTALPEILEGEREIDVTSGFQLDDRSSLDSIRSFELWSPVEQQLVPLRTVTDVQFGRGPTRISRVNQRTTLGLTLDLSRDANPGEVWAGLDLALRDMAFPRGYGWERGEKFRQQEVEDDAMVLALGLSVVFVFLLIGILFESFALPLSIVTTIPMAGLGAVWMLYVTGTQLDFMAFVGLVILVGVIVNNGIVLVDLITQLQAEGVDRTEAIVMAGRRRLRPILMTAFTTICGLLPMALGSSSFIGIPYAPLGRTVIGGLIAGTLLTLLFVPFLYAALDDARHAGTAWFGWLVKRKPV